MTHLKIFRLFNTFFPIIAERINFVQKIYNFKYFEIFRNIKNFQNLVFIVFNLFFYSL